MFTIDIGGRLTLNQKAAVVNLVWALVQCFDGDAWVGTDALVADRARAQYDEDRDDTEWVVYR